MTSPNEVIQKCDIIDRGEGWQAGRLKTTKGLPQYMSKGQSCYFFDNVDAAAILAGELNKLKSWGGEARHDDSSNQDEGDDWTESRSVEQAVSRMLRAPQFYNKLFEQEGRLLAEDSSGNAIYYGVEGEFLDISRYLENDPECFGNTSLGLAQVKLATIALNLDECCSVKQEKIAHKNAWICALVDYLEHNNIRCRVKGYISSQCCHTDVLVKDFQDTLNPNNLAVVSSADFLRRIEFVLTEFSQTFEWGYGNATYNKWHTYPDPEAELTISVGAVDSHGKENITEQFKNLITRFQEDKIFGNGRYKTPKGDYYVRVL